MGTWKRGVGGDSDYLQLTVHFTDARDSIHKQYCSWACTLAELPKLYRQRGVDFIALPFMSKSDTKKRAAGHNFLRILGK